MTWPSGSDPMDPQVVLFVCSGNTCRSPLAEGILRQSLAKRGRTGIEVLSAGSSATKGAAVSKHAREIAESAGLDLDGKRSTPLSADLIERSDLILVMEPHHRTEVLNLVPGADERVSLLGDLGPGRRGRAIADPFGRGADDYRRCYEQLRELIDGGLDELQARLERSGARRRPRRS